MKRLRNTVLICAMALSAVPVFGQGGEILTPKPPATPRINGARVYGERPGRPFLFTIPATGEEPITYSAEGLPEGLKLDSNSGRITGTVANDGEFKVILTATNAQGRDTKPLVIKIGDQLCLTPPMGWNSWNCFAEAVDQDKVMAAADTMAKTGLIKHGWTYINIDDTWQGTRSGKYNGLLSNEKFPDMKGLTDHIHSLGLKAGIYSTPWVQSYAGFAGGSADNSEGTWKKSDKNSQKYDGKYSFAVNDAKQWSEWGFDYLKYDWNPRSPNKVSDEQFHKETNDMYQALLNAPRDIIYSYSNSMPFDQIADQSKMLNCWRTTGDIRDTWVSMSRIGFGQDKWGEFSGPGHWNDPDMLVVGHVGWGPKLHPTQLTPDEQYTHITLWSLLAAPMLIGCDMTQLDDFTLSLLSNDEVIAVNQDALGKQARRIGDDGNDGTEAWARPLSDGTIAVGLFNRGRFEIVPPTRPKKGEANPPKPVWKVRDRQTDQATDFETEAAAKDELQKHAMPAEVSITLAELKLEGSQHIRDLWRQKDLDATTDKVAATIPFHGVVMLKIGTPREQ
jgi:alpha-galactosidase